MQTSQMATNPQIAIVIPVYNAVRALELVLVGYCRQSCRDFELVIGDDGSGSEVRTYIDAFSIGAPFRMRYVAQPDEGYRKCRILNQAVRASSAPYLIFADADCVPHSDFVAAHWRRRESRTVLCGRRVNLSRRFTASLTSQDVFAGKLERLTLGRIIEVLTGRTRHWDEGFLLKNRTLHAWVNRKKPTLLGSNFSLERSLFEEINGYNEDHVGYGGEDTELEYRLRLAGAQFAWVRHRAIQYHLYHPPRTRSQTNVAVLERTRALGSAVCANGLRKELRLPSSDPDKCGESPT